MPNFRVNDVPKEVECAICLDPWTNPTELRPCRHIFCATCVSRLNKCPECRAPIASRGTPHRLLMNIANSVPVECVDCGWKGTRETSASHRCSAHLRQRSGTAPIGTGAPALMPPTLQRERSITAPSREAAGARELVPQPRTNRAQVRLYFRAEKLLDKDILSKSDPYLVLHSGVSGVCGAEIGRTETIMNNLSPTWETSVTVDHIFEMRQEFHIKVYDSDGYADDRKNDFLGQGKFLLASVIGARKRTYQVPLTTREHPNAGVVHITAQEVNPFAHDEIGITLRGDNLENRSKLVGSSDPYFKLHRLLPDGSKRLIYTSEVIRNDLNPVWFPIRKLKLADLADDDLTERSVTIEVFNRGLFGREDYMGETTVSISRLMVKGAEFAINKVRKGKSGRGKIVVAAVDLVHRPTFIEYIKAGMDINLAVSIDFTSSNGDPRRRDSLHSIAAGRGNGTNQYAKAISSVGDILMEYDTDKQVPAFGFGAALPSNPNEASHFFSLTMTDDPRVTDVAGVLDAYWDAVYSVALFGPTNFEPTIRNVTAIARESRAAYSVLLILTDGEITDMDRTVDAIVDADDAPLSIVIVGVGHECNFTAMIQLDGDDDRLVNRHGRPSRRDIVQFIPMRNFANAPIGALAAEVLYEIPGQFMLWAEKFGANHGIPQVPDPFELTSVPPGHGNLL